MESLGVVSIVGCQLPCQFFIEFWNPQFKFAIHHMIVVYFGPCAHLPLLLVCGWVSSPRERGSLIQLHQLTQLVDANQRVISLKFTFLDFKHNYNQRSFSVVINCRNNFCPVQIILDYLSLSGSGPGPLFCLADGSPVSRAIFVDKLSMAIGYCGLDPSRYKGHSFRIGAASYAANARMSDSQIRALGHWKSDALHKYIRIPSLST